MAAFGWKPYGDGGTPPPGEVVRPDERLSWPRTAGLGAQHVVAMFGATFVFPVVMGLDPNLAVMMSGVATPSFSANFVLLALPAVIALIAENTGHVKAVAEMTGADLDRSLGRALLGDGVGTSLASLFGGSPTTTYAENIGVMAATRVYSTAAYYVAALVAILFGLCPKFGALVSAAPGGVLGGITVVLYGMIGLLGAKIWRENGVDFGNPINLVPLVAGIVIAIGNVSLKITNDFSLTGIALGTIVAIGGYHLVRVLAPDHMRAALASQGPVRGTAPDAVSPARGTGRVAGENAIEDVGDLAH